MTNTPIRRGTAQRLGLELPQHVLTMRVEPDLSGFRSWGVSVESIQSPRVDWGSISIGAHLDQLRSGVGTQ